MPTSTTRSWSGAPRTCRTTPASGFSCGCAANSTTTTGGGSRSVSRAPGHRRRRSGAGRDECATDPRGSQGRTSRSGSRHCPPTGSRKSFRSQANVVSVLSRLFSANWGPRTDDVLRVALLTLHASPEISTLAQVPRLVPRHRTSERIRASTRRSRLPRQPRHQNPPRRHLHRQRPNERRPVRDAPSAAARAAVYAPRLVLRIRPAGNALLATAAFAGPSRSGASAGHGAGSAAKPAAGSTRGA